MSAERAEAERLERLERRQRRIAWSILASMGAYVLAAIALDRYGRDRIPTGRYDAIIVAGARVWSDGEPSLTLLRRTERAVELWKAKVAPVMVMTGGVGRHPPSEAGVAADVALAAGVPAAAILLEDRSRSTEQNASFSRALLGERRVLVVTDAYHVLRSQHIYDRYYDHAFVLGVDIGWRPPVIESLREVAAVAWYFAGRALPTGA